MNSIDASIAHDHVYTGNSEAIARVRQTIDCVDELDTSAGRKVRAKRDVRTEHDREEYCRRRAQNNASCRISRLYRRSEHDMMLKKCAEYEDRNTRLRLQLGQFIRVIKQLKEHLRSSVLQTQQ